MTTTAVPYEFAFTPWADDLVDILGHPPESPYVDTFWLPWLGPTPLHLWRLINRRLSAQMGPSEAPRRVTIGHGALSYAVGCGERIGKHTPVVRSLERLERYDLAYCDGDVLRPGHPDTTWMIRRHVMPLDARRLERMPEEYRAMHEAWDRSFLAAISRLGDDVA